MSLLKGLSQVALGVACVAFAPIAGSLAAGLAVSAGIVAGVAGTGSIVSAGAAVVGLAEGSATALGTAIAAKGVKEASS